MVRLISSLVEQIDCQNLPRAGVYLLCEGLENDMDNCVAAAEDDDEPEEAICSPIYTDF